MGAWSVEEDKKLLELYKKYEGNHKKWRVISQSLNRDPRLVRLHYVNQLDPTFTNTGSEWTSAENHILLDEMENAKNFKYVPRWAEISRQMKRSLKDIHNQKEKIKKRLSNCENFSSESVRNSEHCNFFGEHFEKHSTKAMSAQNSSSHECSDSGRINISDSDVFGEPVDADNLNFFKNCQDMDFRNQENVNVENYLPIEGDPNNYASILDSVGDIFAPIDFEYEFEN
jgi:hypothetical protein